MANQIRKLMAAALICSFVTTSYAMGTGMYVGLDLGYSNLNNKARAVPAYGASTITNPNGSTSPSAAGPTVSPKNTGAAGRLFIGGYVTDYFGLEFGLGRYAPSTYNTPAGNTGNIHTSEFDFEGIPKYSFGTSGFSVFGKLGFAYLRSVQSRKLTTEGNSSNNSGLHPLVGLGVGYDLTQRWLLDVAWTRVISRSKALPSPNFISLGISYHWTDQYCGQFLC